MPRIFGKGTMLFDGNFDTNLKLIKVRKLKDDVQLRYKVTKFNR